MKRAFGLIWLVFLVGTIAGPLAAQQQLSPDYAALTQRDQPGDARLRCTQISVLLGQMNELAANSSSSSVPQSRGASGSAGRAVGSAVASKARGFLSSLGGGIFSGLAAATGANQEYSPANKPDSNANLRRAAVSRRDRLLELASAKSCTGDPALVQVRAAQVQSSQDSRDTPMHFIQRNDPPAETACRVGNLAGQFCSDGPMSSRARELVSKGVTLHDAVKCNSVFTLMVVFGNSDSIGQYRLPYTAVNQNNLLWDIIWHLSPNVQNATSAESRQGYFIRARDTPIQDDLPKYRSNEKLMLTDYKFCIAKGIIPGEMPD